MHKRFLAIFLTVILLVLGLAAVSVAAEEADITLLYDDRKPLSQLTDATGTVSVTNEEVTSYKVGSQEKDDHVLIVQDGTVYAVGTGTATLTVGQTSYTVKVNPAPISLFMITGHSIGAGQEGNGTQSVVVEAGQAYSSYHQKSLDVTKVDGYGLGWGSENRVGNSGIMRWDSYGQLDAFAPGEGGNTGAGSGFAYRWNQLTGEKVWVINIAVGGSCLNEWLPGTTGHNTAYDTNYYGQTVSKFTYAQTILKNEQAAGHYTLAHQGILNFPGYNFTWYNNWSIETLKDNYETLWNAYEKDLTTVDIDGDGTNDGLDVMSFTVCWANGGNLYDRPAAWYMGTNGQFGQHVVASAGTLDWCADLSTFPQIDYTTQSVAPYMPVSKYHTDKGGTSDQSLFCKDDTTHYSQVGYNAIGLDMGKNLSAYFKNGAGEAEVTSLRLETYNSQLVGENVKLYAGQMLQITPVVKPVTVSNLTYEVTGNAELTWPLAVKANSAGTATLTVKQGSKTLQTVNITILPAHTHCECGGTLTGVAAEHHTCSAPLTYVPLTRDSYTCYRYNSYDATNMKFNSLSEYYVLRSGNYFLDGDYNLGANSITVAPGETVNICLNGYKITSTVRTFKPNGNLNICDCSEHGTGSVYANTTSAAPILYTYSGADVKIYGGAYTAAEAPKREFAGLIGVANDMGMYDVDIDNDGDHDGNDKLSGAVSIYAGKFVGTNLNCTDGSPTGMGAGACIYIVNTKSTLKIYGGEFVGARPVPAEDGAKGGGGIIGSNGVCYIYGGTFRGSRCNMGAIWTQSSQTYISGSPVFEDNDEADIFLHYCDHLYVGEAGLQMETPIRVAGSVDNYTKIHLTDANEAASFVGVHGLTMTQPDASLVMKFTRDNTYCECGGQLSEDIKKLSGHVCKDATWTSLNQTNQTNRFTTTSTTQGQTSTARYYLKSKEVWLYLCSNVNLTNEIEISVGYTLHIDLNGYTLTHSAASGSLFRVYGTLTVCDSSEAQDGKAVGVRIGTDNAEASCVYALNYNSYAKVLGAPQFHLYGGTLTGGNVTSATNRTQIVANQAGVVQIGNNAGNKDAKFYMYGGTIRDGYAKTAGNVYLGHGQMYMYDGLITGGEAANTNGGNLKSLSGNTLKILGGTIEKGIAKDKGGNISIDGKATVTIENACITDGTAGNGGNLFATGGGVLTVANTRILGGTATVDCGGNLYLSGGTATLSNCEVTNGWTKNWGGNLYVTGACQATVTDTDILGGCGREGGNVYVYGSASNSGTKLVMTGGSVKNGYAGFVYSRKSDGTLTATDNKTTVGNAGNLLVSSYSAAELTDVVMENGASLGRNGSEGFGGNCYNRGTLRMDGCTVSGGSGFRGGVVGIRDNGGQGASYTELKNCTFFQNTASTAGSSVALWANNKGAEILIENCTFDDSEIDTRMGVISLTDQNCTAPITLTLKDIQVSCTDPQDTDAYAVYASCGTVILQGDAILDSTCADLYLLNKATVQADSFAPTAPISLNTNFIGKIGTSTTDKSDCFTSDTLDVTWSNGDLLVNGLILAGGNRYTGIAQALAANETTLTLLASREESFANDTDLWLNLSGFTLTGDITGNGTLYCYDTSSDEFTAPKGRITGAVSCNLPTQIKGDAETMGAVKRYMVIADETGYTAHRFYLGITKLTLRTGDTGFGYKARFRGDGAVVSQLKNFGFSLNLTGHYPVIKSLEASELDTGKEYSLVLRNFDIPGFGDKAVNATVFMELLDGTKIETDPVSYSMKDMLTRISGSLDEFTATQIAAVKAMCQPYQDILKTWGIEALVNDQ